MLGQRQQPRHLLGEDLADATALLAWTAAVRCHAEAPRRGLGIEIVEIGEAASGEEGVAHIAARSTRPFSLARATATGRGS